MKKTFRTLSVMALAGLVMLGSCKKNDENNNTNTNAGDGVLRAGIEQPTSNAKTSLDPTDGAINWTAGDQILVYGNANNGTFTLIEGAESNDATFRCPQFPVEEQTSFRAAYPAGNATINGNEVIFNIPAEQTLTAMNTFGNGANPMVAYSTTESMQFKSVFGGVGIKLTGTAAACHVTKLVLTDNNNMLCGQFKVADITVDNPQAVYNEANGGNTITVNLPEGGVTVDDETSYNVYVMLPEGALSNGFTLAAYDGDFVVKTATTTQTEATVVCNTVQNQVVKFVAELPAGQANTAAAVMAIIADPEQTGPVDIVGTGTLNFNGYSAPNNQQIVVAEGADVEIENLNASTSTAAPAMVIESGATVELSNVSLTSTSTASNSRAINVVGAVSGEGISVTLNDCNLEGGTSAYSRGLNVWSDGEPVEVNVVGGEIHAGHYAVNIPTSENVTINLSNASIASGWAAINVWGENNTINATNCILRGTNDKTYNADGWNDFATIAFNNDNVNNTVNLAGCQIIAESTTGNKQYAIRMYTGNNTISIDNACTLSKGVGNPNTPNWYAYYAGSNTTGSNWEIDDATFEAFDAAWGLSKSVNSKPATFQAPYVLNDKSSEK